MANSFDALYLYDLHGNLKRNEKQPDGSPDSNVFDIQQGVSITLGIKGVEKSISHCHLYGSRGTKYEKLISSDINSTNWQVLSPQAPFYLLIPQDKTLLPEYQKGWKITEVTKLNSTGFVTHRDHFAVSFDLAVLQKNITDFRNLSIEDNEISNLYKLKDTRDWKININRKNLASNKEWKNYFKECLHRPFDLRAYYYHKNVALFPRTEIMQHFEYENFGLVCVRQQSQSGDWTLAWVTDSLTECCAISNKTKEKNYIFPLYLYTDTADFR